MSAETTVFVKVIRVVVGWAKVQATTLEEAKAIAKSGYDVMKVLDAQYTEPDTDTQLQDNGERE